MKSEELSLTRQVQLLRQAIIAEFMFLHQNSDELKGLADKAWLAFSEYSNHRIKHYNETKVADIVAKAKEIEKGNT